MSKNGDSCPVVPSPACPDKRREPFYAATGTLARHVIDGAKEIRIYGEKIPVRARIHTINGFSAHADHDELLDWHKQIGNPERTFLVHGEEEVMCHFASCLKGTEIIMPALNEVFTI